MALVASAQVVTDQSAVPAVKTNSQEKGGVVRTAQGFLAAATYVGGTVAQWFSVCRRTEHERYFGRCLVESPVFRARYCRE